MIDNPYANGDNGTIYKGSTLQPNTSCLLRGAIFYHEEAIGDGQPQG